MALPESKNATDLMYQTMTACISEGQDGLQACPTTITSEVADSRQALKSAVRSGQMSAEEMAKIVKLSDEGKIATADVANFGLLAQSGKLGGANLREAIAGAEG